MLTSRQALIERSGVDKGGLLDRGPRSTVSRAAHLERRSQVRPAGSERGRTDAGCPAEAEALGGCRIAELCFGTTMVEGVLLHPPANLIYCHVHQAYRVKGSTTRVVYASFSAHAVRVSSVEDRWPRRSRRPARRRSGRPTRFRPLWRYEQRRCSANETGDDVDDDAGGLSGGAWRRPVSSKPQARAAHCSDAVRSRPPAVCRGT